MPPASSLSHTVDRLSYGSHPRQVLHLYSPTPAPSQRLPLLVFLHGGAWRAGSIATHSPLASSLAAAGTCCVALVEYRLSLPDEAGSVIADQHPAHIHDTHLALKLLILTPPSERYDSRQAVLVGHSIGAWLLCSILLDCTPALSIPRPSAAPLSEPELTTIRSAIKKWVLVDGIYDLRDLLDEYPEYAEFVSQAFVPSGDPPLLLAGDERMRAASISAWPADPTEGHGQGGVILAHSKDDELLTPRQSRRAADYLRGVLGVTRIQEDYITLTGKHDDLLQTKTFRDWLESFV